jgi:hypothetical protein
MRSLLKTATRLTWLCFCLSIGYSRDSRAFDASPHIATLASSLDTWSRVQLSLRPAQLPKLAPNVHSMDFRDALRHARSKAVANAPSIDAYIQRMSLYEAMTFKGFVYEQSLVRRWNRRAQSERFTLASHGDAVADIIDRNPKTGAVRRLQLYGGKNPVAALEKLFGSDRYADKIVITRDVFDRIKQGYGRAAEILRQHGTVAALGAEGVAAVEAELKPLGLRFDAKTGNVSLMSKGSLVNLGQLGSAEIDAALTKLVRDKLTSAQVQRTATKVLMENDPSLRQVLVDLGDSPAVLDSIIDDLPRLKKVAEIRKLEVRARAGDPRATKALERAPRGLMSELERYQLARRDAILSGASLEEIAAALGDLRNRAEVARQGKAGPALALTEAADILERLSRDARRRQLMAGRRLVGGMTIFGAFVQFATDRLADGKEAYQFIEDGHLGAWCARGAIGLAAFEAAAAAESFVIRRLVARTATGNSLSTSTRLMGRFAGAGIAGLLFVAGESLIQACVYEASWHEVADAAKEAAVVMAVAEGAVLAVELVAQAAGIGSIGGPLGIAVAVGATAAYQGGKHLFTARHQYVTDNLVFAAKCSATRAALDEWASHTLQAPAGGR